MARIISSAETSFLLRDKLSKGIQKITFSKWVVTDHIPLITMCYKSEITSYNYNKKKLYNAYLSWLASSPKYIQYKSLNISDFLASEFAKDNIKEYFYYMISAFFSQISIEKGMAGIYYPSVRVGYQGYNVAIAPPYVDNCQKLIVSAECTLYKNGDQSILDNESLAIIQDDNQTFTYNPVDPKYHQGRDAILKKLHMH